jgi:hypothetical protein
MGRGNRKDLGASGKLPDAFDFSDDVSLIR